MMLKMDFDTIKKWVEPLSDLLPLAQIYQSQIADIYDESKCLKVYRFKYQNNDPAI